MTGRSHKKAFSDVQNFLLLDLSTSYRGVLGLSKFIKLYIYDM